MPLVKANGIEIEVERHGAENGTPLILVRGLGSQLIHWPSSLIDGFVEKGFHVIAFDNRDTGLSSKFSDWGVPDIAMLQEQAAAGEALDVPYTLSDMAGDAISVLDSCGIEKAHVMGISMGGGIVQHLAMDHADRLLSATIVMSSSGAADLPPASPEVWELLLAEPESHDRETVIEHTLKCDYAWFSPAFPFDEVERRELIGRAYDRCYDPAASARQYAAVISSRGSADELSNIDLPILVIHGTSDTLVSIEHGRDIAARISGARLVEIEGMGHDLEGAVPRMIVDNLSRFVRDISKT